MKATIERALMAYGVLPMVVVIERLEKEQEFELCQQVLEALREHKEARPLSRFNGYLKIAVKERTKK